MAERFVEKAIAKNVVIRQHGFMLIGIWDRDFAEGTETVSMRFRVKARTINTSADTTTGEEEIAPPAEVDDLPVDTSDLTGTLSNAGVDPVTGADLTQISRAGALQWIKALYQAELEAVVSG